MRRSLVRIWFGTDEASSRRHDIAAILVALPLSRGRRALVPNVGEGGLFSWLSLLVESPMGSAAVGCPEERLRAILQTPPIVAERLRL